MSPLLGFTAPDGGEDLQDLADRVYTLQKQLDYLLQNLDQENLAASLQREIYGADYFSGTLTADGKQITVSGGRISEVRG